MTVRSVIDVEIDKDGEFARFAETFDKYQKALAKTPGDWESAGKAQRPTVAAFQAIAAALLAQSALQAKNIKAAKDEAKATKDSSSYWKDMVRSSREVAANASSVAKSLLSAIGVGSIFSGLLGAGGLWGLSDLASGVGGSRRQALGLGSTIGETRAFSLNYGRIVDPGSVIGGVQEALTDPTKRVALYGAGLTEGDLQGKDAAQVAALLINRVGNLVDRTPTALLGSVGTAFGLGQFGLGTQELQRIQGTPASEREQYYSAFNRDRVRLNVPDKQAKLFQDFDVQLSRAGDQIENVFVRGIAPLVPALTKFSEVVVTTLSNFAQKLVDSGALDKFAGGIQAFADYLGTDAFQANVKTFATDVVALGGAVHDALVFFGAVPGGKSNPNETPTQRIGGGFHDHMARNWPEGEARARALRGDFSNLPGFGALALATLPGVGLAAAIERASRGRLDSILGGLHYSVNSGLRDLDGNARVGGRSNSAHLIPGAAFDITPSARDIVEVMRRLRSEGYFVLPERGTHSVSDYRKADHLHVSTAGDRGGRRIPGYGNVLGIGIRVENATGGNVVVNANQLRGQAFQ